MLHASFAHRDDCSMGSLRRIRGFRRQFRAQVGTNARAATGDYHPSALEKPRVALRGPLAVPIFRAP